MKIKRAWAIAAIVLLLASGASWALLGQTGSSADLLKPSAVKTGLQNFSLGYDAEKGILLVGTYKNVLIAYDGGGRELWRFDGKGPFRALKVDSAARVVYAGCEDNNLYILNLDDGALLRSVDVERRIYSVDATAGGGMIAVSAGVNAGKHNLLLYDGEGNQTANVKIGSTSLKTAFSADQKSIYVGTNRGELLAFDLAGNQTNIVKLNYEIVGFEVLPELHQIVAGTKDSSYTVLDESFRIVRSGKAQGDGLSIGVSSDGSYVGLGSKEGFFTLLDKDGRTVYMRKVEYSVTSVLFTGRTAYVTGLGDFLYELDEGRLHTAALAGSLGSLVTVLAIVLPAGCLVCVILAVAGLRRRAAQFFKTLHKHRTAYLMLAPTVALLLVFCYYPAVIAFIRAFTDWSRSQSSMADIEFIGLENFRTMISEGYFFIGLKNLLIIILTSFAKVLTMPLIAAMLVYSMRSARSKYWFRFLFVAPMVVPGVVSALMWAQIYDPTIGLVNQTLHALGLDNWQRVWLGDPGTAIWAIVFMGFPFIDAFAFLVYYGGLISIPSSLFEAAKVDGSNPLWNFTRIQLPLIMPQIKLLVVLTFIGSIQNFANVLLLTAGGPGSATYVPGLELYYNATKFGRYGYACALGVVMFVAILAGTIINMRIKANEAME